MALLLTCPNCGPRPYTEFRFGGECPPAPRSFEREGAEDEAADFDRVWSRTNAGGPQYERWFHHAGCRRWHTALRDTLTQEMHAPT